MASSIPFLMQSHVILGILSYYVTITIVIARKVMLPQQPASFM